MSACNFLLLLLDFRWCSPSVSGKGRQVGDGLIEADWRLQCTIFHLLGLVSVPALFICPNNWHVVLDESSGPKRNVYDDSDEERQRIKTVEVLLVRCQWPQPSLRVFDGSEERSNQNTRTAQGQRACQCSPVTMPTPPRISRPGRWSQSPDLQHPPQEEESERKERNELKDETDEENLPPSVSGAGHQAR